MPLLALRGHLNSFNKTTAIDIRREIFKSQDFDTNYSHKLSSDFDWIRNSIYTLLRLYESGKLKKAHKKSWCLSHVWQFINSAFDNTVATLFKAIFNLRPQFSEIFGHI